MPATKVRTCNGLSLLNSMEFTDLLTQRNCASYIENARKINTHSHDPTPPNNKPTIVLDVDETLLNGSVWYHDIRIGDAFTFTVFSNDIVWILTRISITLVQPQIDRHQRRIELTSNEEMNRFRNIPHETVEYCLEATQNGPEEEALVISPSEMEDMWEPYLGAIEYLREYNRRRPENVPVSFYCDGLMFRLRPFLPEFLEFVCQSYNVVVFTAGIRKVYEKVLRYIEECMKPILNGGPIRFEKAFFRQDCDRVKSTNGRMVYRKDFTKVGVDLSQLVVVDDRHVSFEGFEPNSIRIRPFGATGLKDNQLIRVKRVLSYLVGQTDVRYALCGLNHKRFCARRQASLPNMTNGSCGIDGTCQFLNDLKLQLLKSQGDFRLLTWQV